MQKPQRTLRIVSAPFPTVSDREDASLHDRWDKDRGPETLQQKIGQCLEDSISNKEDSQRGIKLARRHGNIFQEVGYLCIADIGTVEKADQVKKAQLVSSQSFPSRQCDISSWIDTYPRHQVHIKLLKQLAFLLTSVSQIIFNQCKGSKKQKKAYLPCPLLQGLPSIGVNETLILRVGRDLMSRRLLTVAHHYLRCHGSVFTLFRHLVHPRNTLQRFQRLTMVLLSAKGPIPNLLVQCDSRR